MSNDYLPDSQVVARTYCPTCEPEADSSQEPLDVRYCGSHEPAKDGVDDQRVVAAAYLSGSGEVGGEHNRQVCNLVHRHLEPTGLDEVRERLDSDAIPSSVVTPEGGPIQCGDCY